MLLPRCRDVRPGDGDVVVDAGWRERAYASVAATTPSGITVLHLHGDGDATVELANPTVARALGLPVDDLVGHSVRAVSPPAAADEILHQLARAKADGEVHYEAARDLPGGRLVLAVSVLPLGDDRYLIFSRDLSTERSAVRRLQEVERLALVGSFHWNVREDVLSWSDQLYRLFGYDPGEVDVTLDLVLEHVHPEDRDEQERLTARARADGATAPTLFRVTRRDGEVRTLEARAEPALGDDGRLLYVAGTMQDVTERLALEQQAEQARRASARHRTGLEVHDRIVQGLAAAWLALELDDEAAAKDAVQRTMTNAQEVVQGLLGDLAEAAPIAPGRLVRAPDDGDEVGPGRPADPGGTR
jgi:PAS domain S-box-containing protein